MRAWKPRTIRELFTPGYYDRFTWFTAIFGFAIVVIASLSPIVSVLQLGIVVVMLQIASRQENVAQT